MTDRELKELFGRIKKLTAGQQDTVRCLVNVMGSRPESKPNGRPSPISDEDAEAMARSIEDAFERIEPDRDPS